MMKKKPEENIYKTNFILYIKPQAAFCIVNVLKKFHCFFFFWIEETKLLSSKLYQNISFLIELENVHVFEILEF